MTIIEKKIRSKYINSSVCEDGCFISDDYIVVVDGATSRNKYLWDNKSSGEYTKDLIISSIENFERDLSCEKFFKRLNGCLNKEYESKSDIPISERLRASIIVYSDFQKEIWSVGDCQCKINYINKSSEKKIDLYIAEVRSMLIQSFLAQGISERELLDKDISRKIIEPLIDQQFYLENTNGEYGYPVMNGFLCDYSTIKKYKVQEGDIVILATDGYPILENNLEESERTLSQLLEEDPLMYKQIKCTKGLSKEQCSFDDRCYIRFVV